MSSSSLQMAKDALLSLTDFQRDMHTLNEKDGRDIASRFHKKFVKSTWHSSVLMKLESKQDGDNVVYSVNNSFHYLEYTYRCVKTPAIKVKNEYIGKVRISLCNNFGNNIAQSAVFKEDDDEYQTIDHVWGDIHPQFFQKGGAGGREGYDLGVGNNPCLEEWTDFLPPYDINIEDPWFYAIDPAEPFPIWPKGSSTKAEMRYTYRRKIFDLLRLEILLEKDGVQVWRPLKNSGTFKKYVDVSGELKVPELWGRYSYVTDAELGYYNSCDDDSWIVNDDLDGAKQKVYYTRDVAICDIPNPIKYKNVSQIDLSSSNPCLAFFWVAENADATAIHNHSNYTTNTNNIRKGWDPVKQTTLTIGGAVVLDKMESHHFSIAQSRHHFPSTPHIPGYHGYSNASNSNNFNGDVGIVYDDLKAKLKCLIDNNDIFINSSNDEEDEDEDDDNELDAELSEYIENSSRHYKSSLSNNDFKMNSSPDFLVRVRLLIVRKFTITRHNGKCTYEIK